MEEVVCIFAEGQMTRIGQMLPFRRGFERNMKNIDAPIIPFTWMAFGGEASSVSNAGATSGSSAPGSASHHRQLR
jgi:acyl-[acyl-carrier-protein]-phospholipid O-acyltransferase/long-chain-fatty-acid--[acyl-carrier-protein] ligase